MKSANNSSIMMMDPTTDCPAKNTRSKSNLLDHTVQEIITNVNVTPRAKGKKKSMSTSNTKEKRLQNNNSKSIKRKNSVSEDIYFEFRSSKLQKNINLPSDQDFIQETNLQRPKIIKEVQQCIEYLNSKLKKIYGKNIQGKNIMVSIYTYVGKKQNLNEFNDAFIKKKKGRDRKAKEEDKINKEQDNIEKEDINQIDTKENYKKDTKEKT
ncbi:hypothetical protein K502DRAFT_327827 [Neoconidiobolus thromboides FSU 785]|nr:hypothetical protein K502DRAFT_327827 [Neoconidiobolus thromboides FSU 785]